MHEILMVLVVGAAYGIAWIEVRGEARQAKREGLSLRVGVRDRGARK